MFPLLWEARICQNDQVPGNEPGQENITKWGTTGGCWEGGWGDGGSNFQNPWERSNIETSPESLGQLEVGDLYTDFSKRWKRYKEERRWRIWWRVLDSLHGKARESLDHHYHPEVVEWSEWEGLLDQSTRGTPENVPTQCQAEYS